MKGTQKKGFFTWIFLLDFHGILAAVTGRRAGTAATSVL